MSTRNQLMNRRPLVCSLSLAERSRENSSGESRRRPFGLVRQRPLAADWPLRARQLHRRARELGFEVVKIEPPKVEVEPPATATPA